MNWPRWLLVVQLNKSWGIFFFRFWHWVSLLFHFINHQWVISYIPMIQTTVCMSEWLTKSLIQLLYDVQLLGITIPSAKSPRYPYLNRSQTELKIPTPSLKISFVFQYLPLACVYVLFWFTCWVQKKYFYLLYLYCILDTRTLTKWMKIWMMV